jgi:hypothetical protein
VWWCGGVVDLWCQNGSFDGLVVKRVAVPVRAPSPHSPSLTFSAVPQLIMGGKKRVKQRKDTGKKAEVQEGEEAPKDPRDSRTPKWSSEPVDFEDNMFVKYFGPNGLDLIKKLGRPEAEWGQMMDALKRQLPSTFRISPVGNFEKRTARSLDAHVKKIIATTTYPVLDTDGALVASGPPHLIGDWVKGGWSTGTYRSGLKQVRAVDVKDHGCAASFCNFLRVRELFCFLIL